jgi:hypothetical protein
VATPTVQRQSQHPARARRSVLTRDRNGSTVDAASARPASSCQVTLRALSFIGPAPQGAFAPAAICVCMSRTPG